MKKKRSFSRAAVFLVSAAFLASILPLLTIARYDHPSADDFTYGLLAAQAWRSTGSVFSVLSAAFQTVHDAYFNWQGSFSGVFLMAVQPAVFGEHLYFLTPVVLLLFLFLSTLFLYWVVLRVHLKAENGAVLILTMITVGMSVHFMPSPVEGLYWYNGAVYYTGFYSLSLVVFGMALLLFHSESGGRLIFYSVSAAALSFFLGGSNFTTALLTLLVLAAMTAAGFLCKNRRSFLLLLAVLACAAGLAVSAAAPGNSVRKTNFPNTPPAAEAIVQSFRAALNFLYEKTTLPVIVCMVFVLPILYGIARRAPLSFRLPLLVPAVTFSIFSAQFTPPLFAMGFVGPTRLLNIIYYSYFPLLLINAFYLLGWLARKWGAGETAETELFSRFSAATSQNAVSVLLCFSIVFPAACVGSNNVRKIAGVSALLSLRNGQAAQYDAEADRRLEVYKDPSVRNVSAAAFSQKPYVLYFTDIEPDKDHWRNVAVAKYYNKETVVRKGP